MTKNLPRKRESRSSFPISAYLENTQYSGCWNSVMKCATNYFLQMFVIEICEIQCIFIMFSFDVCNDISIQGIHRNREELKERKIRNLLTSYVKHPIGQIWVIIILNNYLRDLVQRRDLYKMRMTIQMFKLNMSKINNYVRVN